MKLHLNQLNYQPSTLTEAEIKEPTLMLTNFFEIYPLHRARQNAWEFYKAWVNHTSNFTDGELNANMLFFYTQLIDLLDASYLYTQIDKDNPFK